MWIVLEENLLRPIRKVQIKVQTFMKLFIQRLAPPPLSPTIYGNKSFITFIDDFFQYGYLHLIKEKSEALEKFKNLKQRLKNNQEM